MLKLITQKGFETTFKNGIKIRVVFGAGNYCQNYDKDQPRGDYSDITSKDAEVVITDVNGGDLTEEYLRIYDKPSADHGIAGYCDADEVANMISFARKWR